MSEKGQKPSQRERECQGCGHRWISAQSTCPQCGSFAKAGDEVTKKVVDDSDLRKAWR